MPRKRAAFKHLRKSKKKHKRNLAVMSTAKTLIKKFNALVSEKKFDNARTLLKSLHASLDKAASKGAIHKNMASRKVSRLARKLARAASSK